MNVSLRAITRLPLLMTDLNFFSLASTWELERELYLKEKQTKKVDCNGPLIVSY
jgi:hypothetical protein